MLTTAATLAGSPPPKLPGFLNIVGSYLGHYGYWAILALVMVEDFGVPVPGETILIAGAVYAGAGRLNIVAVGMLGFIAAVAGDNIGFAIGHFGGRALALRWGRFVFLNEERLDRAQSFFNRHGGKIITIARFIEGLRQANGIIAGISGMHWRRFLAFNALGAALWVGTWVSLGYLAGQHITTIYNYITRYSYYVLIAVAVLLVAYIALRLWGRRRLLAPDAASRTGAASKTGAASDTGAASKTHVASETHAASETDETHEIRDAGKAAGITPGEPDRGERVSPRHAAQEHPPAEHQPGS